MFNLLFLCSYFLIYWNGLFYYIRFFRYFKLMIFSLLLVCGLKSEVIVFKIVWVERVIDRGGLGCRYRCI